MPRAAVPRSRLARVGVSPRNRRPAPGRGCRRRPGRPPAFRAFPEVGPYPRSSPENPGRSGNRRRPAASCLFYWVWSLGGKLLCIFILKMILKKPMSSIKTPNVRSARQPSNSKYCTVTKLPAAAPLPGLGAAALEARSGSGGTSCPGCQCFSLRAGQPLLGAAAKCIPRGTPRGRGVRLGSAAEANMGSDSGA